MRRRDVIAGLGAAAGWPLAVRAQEVRPVVGFLGSGTAALMTTVAGFLSGLKEAGFVDGQNVAIEYRWAEGRFEQISALAADLVGRRVQVLVAAQGNVSALAAKQATSTIPIVFITSDDPVATGLVASLNRPGGNMTGVARLGTQLGAKNVELLHALLPSVSVIGLLVNPKRPNVEAQVKIVRNAANTFGKAVRVLEASDEREIEAAFKEIASERLGALLIPFDSAFNIHRHRIVALVARLGVPAAYSVRDFVTAGGLMSYGDDPNESYRLGGDLAGRILKGAKPADLPVQQATKVELVLNLKTAKALGLTIPITLLGRADEVIE